jgi:small subunit ribosomal protein S19
VVKMARKEFSYKGKNIEELASLSTAQFIELLPSRFKRKFNRGLTMQEQILLKKIEKGKNNIKTHSRELMVLPCMFGKTLLVYNGKEYIQIMVNAEMSGHVLGEFSQTRKTCKHSSPGVGATKSSAPVSK